MKRIVWALALVAFAAAPVAAQLAGLPVYNSPKGGTGVTVNGDVGFPNTDAGGGNTFGARASLGISKLTLGAGASLYKGDAFNDRIVSVGGNVAVKVFGGGVLPLSVNVQGGAARTAEASSGATTINSFTTLTAAVGVSLSPPTPGLGLEVWASPGLRYTKVSGASGDSNFGFAIGASASFGLLGVHAAYDYTSLGGGVNSGVFGVGAHVAIKVPVPGM